MGLLKSPNLGLSKEWTSVSKSVGVGWGGEWVQMYISVVVVIIQDTWTEILTCLSQGKFWMQTKSQFKK